MVTNNSVNISSAGLVDYNGTGTFSGISHVNNAVLTSGASGTPAFTSLGADGQLIIGSSAGAPTAATLTAGSNITITNGHNSITIATTGTTSQTTGTFTPTLIGGTVAGTTTYTTQQGYYINTGSEVVAIATVDATPGNTATGDAHLDGLPFTIKNQANGNTASAGIFSRTITSLINPIGLLGQLNTTYQVAVKEPTNGFGSNVLITTNDEYLVYYTIVYQK